MPSGKNIHPCTNASTTLYQLHILKYVFRCHIINYVWHSDLILPKETGLEFTTFDILGDEEIRQGLKAFSNWPTYPQVYVKGELIGGLDIIKELKESGELTTNLKGE